MSLKQLNIFGYNIGPISLYISLLVLVINIIYIKIFYKELKIVSFDPAFAAVLGFSPIIIHYSLMALVSLTAVTAFSAVGSILVVALMVGPAITAMQFTKDLKTTIYASAIIASINTILGYLFAIILDVSIASLIATLTLVTFLIVLLFSPKEGIIVKQVRRYKQRKEFDFIVFLKHLTNHLNTHDLENELSISNIHNELNWNKNYVIKYNNIGRNLGFLEIKR